MRERVWLSPCPGIGYRAVIVRRFMWWAKVLYRDHRGCAVSWEPLWWWCSIIPRTNWPSRQRPSSPRPKALPSHTGTQRRGNHERQGGMGYWNRVRVVYPLVFKARMERQEEIGPGAYFFRDRDTGERFGLKDLDPNAGRHDEPAPSCSFFCEIAEQQYSQRTTPE